MKKLKLLAVLAGFAVAGVVSTQAADKALLNTLVQKGYLTSEEARNLSKTSIHAEGDRGDVFGEQANTNSIAIGGSAHVRYQYVDPTLKNRPTGTTDLHSTSSFLVRKAKLGMKASVWDDWRIELVGVYNEVSTTLDTALISWDYMEELSFDFGFGPTPASYENSMAGSDVKTMERSIASQYFGGQLGMSDNHVGIFMRGQNVADLEGWRYWMAFTRPDSSVTNSLSNVTSESNSRNRYPAFFASTGYKFDYEDVHFDTWANFGYQRNQRQIIDNTSTTPTVGNQRTNDFLLSLGINTMWEDFTLLAEVYGASLEKGKINSINNKGRAKPAGLTIMPSYMYDDQWEFVFNYSLIRAKDASLTNLATTGRTAGTTNGRGVDLQAISSNYLSQLTAGNQAGANNTGYNDVSSYGFNVNYFPIKGSRQLKLAAGYEFIKARKASTKTANGATGTISDTHLDSHVLRADVRMVF